MSYKNIPDQVEWARQVGEQVARVVLRAAHFQCSTCKRIRPAKCFGLRYDKKTKVLTNHLHCITCRGEFRRRRADDAENPGSKGPSQTALKLS